MDSWTTHMRRGDFAAAWAVSDAVLAQRRGTSCTHRPRHEQWVWDGRPLTGQRVLVRCYHGLGDTIQFVRYAPLLGTIARATTWWMQPALIPLLREVPGIGRVVPLHEGAPQGEYDAEIESMELAHAFRSSRDSLPGTDPYVQVDPQPLERVPGHRNVGLVWRAGDWDPRRSIQVGRLEPLTQLRGIRLHVVQHQPAPHEVLPGFVITPHKATIVGTARLIGALDLVISVDSMPAHLAGALGVPVWTLLSAEADWRWMEAVDTSPWYPTMRLFRQRKPGDWAGVISGVCEALEQCC